MTKEIFDIIFNGIAAIIVLIAVIVFLYKMFFDD